VTARCSTCRYSERLSCMSVMVCRRYPPRVVPAFVSVEDVYNNRDGIGAASRVAVETLTELPEVTGDDWCGEWKAVPDYEREEV